MVTNVRGLLLGALLIAPLFSLQADSLIIPQIADGGGWKTTFVISNTSASATTVTLVFHQANADGGTQIWNLGLQEVSSTQNLALAGGGTLFLHTFGTAANTSVGWGEVQAGSAVQAYAVFASSANVEATAPGQTGTTRLLVPFDNSTGFTTSLALVNLSSSAQAVAVGIRSSGGTVSNTTLGTVPALGHMAFALPTQLPATAGTQGLAEFTASSGNLAGVALRFNPLGNFTAAPVYSQSGSPILVATATAPQASSVTLVSSSLVAGATAQATVTLSAAAPAGGAVVTLSSSSSSVSIPASVSVAAGAASATFTVAAGSVGASTSVTISAAYGGNTAKTTFTVTPGTKVAFDDLEASSLLFQPAGYAPYTLDFIIVPNVNNVAVAANLGSSNPSVLFAVDGATPDGGKTFVFNQLTNNYFYKPNTFTANSVTYTITSALLSVATTAASTTAGTVSGTLTLVGQPSGGGASLTLTGPVSGAYTASY